MRRESSQGFRSDQKLSLQLFNETLHGNIRTRQNVQIRDEYQVSNCRFSEHFTHALHVDVESTPKLLLDSPRGPFFG